MNTHLFISDRQGRAEALLSFEDGVLANASLMEGGDGQLAERLKEWRSEGIDVIGEIHEETDAGMVHRLYSERVPVTDAQALPAIRLWVRQNGYIDLPLTRAAMRCAELIAKTALLPEERTALITSFVGLDAERLAEVEEQLRLV